MITPFDYRPLRQMDNEQLWLVEFYIAGYISALVDAKQLDQPLDEAKIDLAQVHAERERRLRERAQEAA